MARSSMDATSDLLGSPRNSASSGDHVDLGGGAGGKVVDLSGASSKFTMPTAPPPGGTRPATSTSSTSFSSSSPTSFGGGGYSGGGYGGGGFGSADRGPTSIEGGSGGGLSLSDLTPSNLMRQLASKPITDLVVENGRSLAHLPQVAVRAYSAAARRYLRPWTEFGRIRPSRIVEGFRQARRRGEIQIYVQRNVLANARRFCPNYVFIFLAMLFMFVCTSPYLLCMLAAVGGGWSSALRSDQFRNRPWMLQIGGLQVPLGHNLKMLIMALPTLLFLHFFMGPVLWSAALCSGGVGLAHAALRDRDDDHDEDDDDHGLGSSTSRFRSMP